MVVEAAVVAVLVNAQTLLGLGDGRARHAHLLLRCVVLVVGLANLEAQADRGSCRAWRTHSPALLSRVARLARLLSPSKRSNCNSAPATQLLPPFHPGDRAVGLPRAEDVQPRSERAFAAEVALVLRPELQVQALQVGTLFDGRLLQFCDRGGEKVRSSAPLRFEQRVGWQPHGQRQLGVRQREHILRCDEFLLPRRGRHLRAQQIGFDAIPLSTRARLLASMAWQFQDRILRPEPAVCASSAP